MRSYSFLDLASRSCFYKVAISFSCWSSSGLTNLAFTEGAGSDLVRTFSGEATGGYGTTGVGYGATGAGYCTTGAGYCTTGAGYGTTGED